MDIELDVANIVMMVDWGEDENEVMMLYGLTHENLEEIMSDHNYERCTECSMWSPASSLDNGLCEDCWGDESNW